MGELHGYPHCLTGIGPQGCCHAQGSSQAAQPTGPLPCASRSRVSAACRAAGAAGSGAPGNLGQLQSLAAPEAGSDSAAAFWELQQQQLAQFQGRGAGGGELNVDGGAIFASLLLLAIMLYFSRDRILGLDRLFT